MSVSVQKWLKQVTTIHGFMIIGGAVVAAGGAYAQGQHSAALLTLVTGAVAGVIGMVMPDNTQLSSDATAAVTSFVTDIQNKNQQAAMADAVAGAIKVLSDFASKMPATPAPVPAPAPTPVVGNPPSVVAS